MWHATIYRARRKLDQTLKNGANSLPDACRASESRVCYLRGVFASVRQAGHRLWHAYSSPFIFPVDVHLQGFTPDDFSNLKLSPPHQRVQLCQMGPVPANRTTATPATSYQWVLHSTPNSLVILGQASPPVSPPGSPAGLLSSLWMSVTAGGHSNARLGLEVLWRGHSAKAKYPKPLLKSLLWLYSSSAKSFCLLTLF